MKKTIGIFLLFIITINCFSQTEKADTTKTLDSVTVRAFELKSKQPYSSVLITTFPYADFSPKTSLVNGLNAVAGVRMEERSPGSYRLNIRGSSLRSPFGVRNIKVYWNDIPVTDPGGNTYFNQFAWNNFSSIEVVKGPASSMYGAGTGGLVLLNSAEQRIRNGASVEYITGSYNLQNIFVSGQAGDLIGTNYASRGIRHLFSYAHNQTDGYRIQTKMRRDNFSWVVQSKGNHHDLTASVLFTDMYYQTPGALTLAEFNTNPKAARPAGGGFPSAVNAKAAIYQKNILIGISNLFRLTNRLKNTTAVYGSFAQIKNPAIRNYERRNEPSFGGRSFFSYDQRFEGFRIQAVAGAEFQQGYFNTQVSKNRNGNPDTLQTNDDIDNSALSVFAQVNGEIDNTWLFAAGISDNKTKINITRLNRYPVLPQGRTFRNEIAPRFFLLKRFDKGKTNVVWSVIISKGFSPPTVAEVLPSTGVISIYLEAEKGWNYETTLRCYTLKNKLKLELTGFYFKLYNALVQRRDLSGADFFVNAGDIRQKGIEFHADFKQRYSSGDLINQFSVRTDITYNHFRYGSFVKGADDFSGKTVPSVPSSVLSLLADIHFKNGFYLNTSYYGASSIYMNDANTAKAEPYHLLGCQFGWKKKEKGQFRLNVYAGIDNLLDETYSLGNDINAAANRFYNAAPRRNYYAGIAVQWIKKTTPKK